jgi:hypothetical protein
MNILVYQQKTGMPVGRPMLLSALWRRLDTQAMTRHM